MTTEDMTTKVDDVIPTAKQLLEQIAKAEAEKAAGPCANAQRQKRKRSARRTFQAVPIR